MKAYLLTIGDGARDALPTILATWTCCAPAFPPLRMLHLGAIPPDSPLPGMIRDLGACRRLVSANPEPTLFPLECEWDSFAPKLPPARELGADPASALLLSALRGPGAPLSYATDRDAVIWATRVAMETDRDGAWAPFDHWIAGMREDRARGEEIRAAMLFDITDAMAAGQAIACLNAFRDITAGERPTLGLTALARTSLRRDVRPEVRDFLTLMDRQGLVRSPDGTPGDAPADTLTLLSLPASLTAGEDPWRLVGAAAAAALGRTLADPETPGPGFHTRSLPGTLTFQALGDRAGAAAASLRHAIWQLTDLLPALRAWGEHPARLRALAPASRGSLIKKYFRGAAPESMKADLDALERCFRALLTEAAALARALPDAFRGGEDAASRWDAAIAACGRYLTEAAELDVSRAEAAEAGVDRVMPVHRDSLADTEEEKFLRRLDEMAERLTTLEKTRDDALKAVGGARAVQAWMESRARCVEAIASAEAKELALEEDPAVPRGKVAAQKRRLRLLRAALDRVEAGAEEATQYDRLNQPAPDGLSRTDPFAGNLLTPRGAQALQRYLQAAAGEDRPARELRDQLADLIPGDPLADGKELLKAFQKLEAPEAGRTTPLADFLHAAHGLCRREAALWRPLPASGGPEIPLLPDGYPRETPVTMRAALNLFPAPETEDHDSFAGLLACLLLTPYRRRAAGEPAVTRTLLTAGDSPLTRAWLAGEGAEKLWVLCLRREETALPFALALPGRALLPARLGKGHNALIPAFAAWWEPEKRRFLGPAPFLGEGDRTILAGQLDRLAALPEGELAPALREALADTRSRLAPPDPTVADPRLPTRLAAVCGLMDLRAYSGILRRQRTVYERGLTEDEVASCLTASGQVGAAACDVADDITYYWKDTPFAREDSHRLLTGTNRPEEEYALAWLEKERAALEAASDDYRDALARNLQNLTDRMPEALPACREAAEKLKRQAEKPLPEEAPTLTWPWDVLSPSIRTLLAECLGPELADSALIPFSDLLAVFPARSVEILPDTLIGPQCVLAPRTESTPETPDALPPAADGVLPPLDPGFLAALCRSEPGRTLIRPGFLALERMEGGAVCAELRIEGGFSLRLRRVYSPEEIGSLYTHTIPTVAIWPATPFPPEEWRAYYIYAHLAGDQALEGVTRGGESFRLDGARGPRAVRKLTDMPVCIGLRTGSRSLGALPNLLPPPKILPKGPVTACVDFGTAGVSVVFADRTNRYPLYGPGALRVLIHNPAFTRDWLRTEFLPAVPVSALLPAVVRRFSAATPGDEPFTDGMMLLAADLRDALALPSGELFPCAKWEEPAGAAAGLCLRQAMLLTALQARLDGASALSWRFAIPDEMAPAGREGLASLFAALAEKTAADSGFPLAEKGTPVAFAPESAALGAYFRGCAPEETRGGFMTLDLGAATADIALFLRGRDQAVRACQLPLGVHYILLPALLRNPDQLIRELGGLPQEAFARDLQLLHQMLIRARSDPAALRHVRLALDTFLADHAALLAAVTGQRLMSGDPGILASTMALHIACLMMMAGLMLLQLAADPNRNDFLPERMTLCVAGRGAALMESLPEPVRAGLWHCLTMFRNRRVSSLTLLFSSEKKMEIPVGLSVLQGIGRELPGPAPAPAAIAVRPEELLPEFLLRFQREFPACAETLFPGFFSGDPYHPLTPPGENRVAAAIQQAFPDQGTPRPYDSIAAWIGYMLE